MSAAAESYQEYVALVNVSCLLYVVDGFLDVGFGVDRAAGFFRLWVGVEVSAAKFRQEQVEVVLFGDWKQIGNLIVTYVAPCVKSYKQRTVIAVCRKVKRWLHGTVKG